MATASLKEGRVQSITGRIPPRRYGGHSSGVDREDAHDLIYQALGGIECIADIIFANNVDKDRIADYWSDDFIDKLHCGQKALVRLANEKLDELTRELWYLRALRGEHGEEAKARAQRELNADLEVA